MKSRWNVWLVMLAILVPALGAEENNSWDNLSKSLKAGKKIRVVRTNLASLEGKFVSISDESITIEETRQTKSIPRSEVFRVSLAGQRSRRAGIGAAIGAASYAGAVAIMYAAKRDVWDFTAGETARFVVLGSALGAGIGAGIGAALPANRTIYRAPAPAPPK